MNTKQKTVDVLAVMDARGDMALMAERTLVRGLEAIGWQLLAVEIDADQETARIELKSGNRLVTFDARNGHATLTRELLTLELAKMGRRGDIFVSERIRPTFIGRSHFYGLRSGLRALSHYVADNSPRPLTYEQARNLFRPLLAAPAHAAIARCKGE